MRLDTKSDPIALALTGRQHFFVSAWFNMVHQRSLDSYRVRVSNPINILQELRKMYEAQADDNDRKIVAEEAIIILSNHPVIDNNKNYKSANNTITLLSEAVSKTKKEKTENSPEKQENAFRKNATLINSFVNELEASLKEKFLEDAFLWLSSNLKPSTTANTPEEEVKLYINIERVCRDILSIVHDEGFSLESLYHLYKAMVPTQKTKGKENKEGTSEVIISSFAERLEKVRGILLAEPIEYRVIFTIGGASSQATHHVKGKYGRLNISDKAPVLSDFIPEDIKKHLVESDQRLFADIVITAKDGRFAGLTAYREIGEILDLVRFEYDSKNLVISSDFVIFYNRKFKSFLLPQLIPNPEADRPTKKLADFVEQLSRVGSRDKTQNESKDRIFAAFRLYRVGTDVTMFENKLVNWWTGLEYLAKGGKSAGGSIGGGVENALAPTLGLVYLDKHLSAFKSSLGALNIKLNINGQPVDVKSVTNSTLYSILKMPSHKADFENACLGQPYLWHHLRLFIESLSTPNKTAAALRAHERRIRWQIQRIYRARCDIVHSGQQVKMASLLCANLEYYLRMTLKTMLTAFQNGPTLRGPSEFFERRRYQYDLVLKQLETDAKTASDSLLFATLEDGTASS